MIIQIWNILEILTLCLSVILPLLLVIAFFTLLERKVMASLQRRIGPNIHGYYGVLQPLIDGLKLLWKEMLIPAKANFYIFMFSPMFMMSLSFALWAVLPLSFTFAMFDSKLSLITFFVISSLNIYNIILAGWSSNSKYAFLGSIRAMGQMFSYELVFGFVLIFMLLTVGSLRIYDIVIKQYYVGYLFWPLLPFAIIFFVSLLMETNRAPFDLSEAESELVAGYNVEYSSIMFAMFFLGEYCNILAMSSIWSLLFWGGFISNYFGVGFFIIKILILSFLFIFIRSMLPRYRIDQLIYVGWHVMLPVILGLCVFITFIISVFNIFPQNSSIYLSQTIPEDADMLTLFKDLKIGSRQASVERLHEWLINEIMTEEARIRTDHNRMLYLTATREHLSPIDFGTHILARMIRLEGGNPVLAEKRSELIEDLILCRWKFNLVRYFSEWLITETGRLPHGWSESNYINFMTGKDPNSFYFVTIDGYNYRPLSEVHGSLSITLKTVEDMFISGRLKLPQSLLDNRLLIAPSKYALLSEAAKAKLDEVSPVRFIQDRSRITWINQYSDILDINYLKNRPKKISFQDPFNANILRLEPDFTEFEIREAEKVLYELEMNKLKNYYKKFPSIIDSLFTAEQIKKYPDKCNSILDQVLISTFKKPVEKSDVCPLYLPDTDITEFPFWDNKETRDAIYKKYA